MEKQPLGIKVKGFTGGIITGVVFCLLITLLIFLGFIISGFDIRALVLFFDVPRWHYRNDMHIS